MVSIDYLGEDTTEVEAADKTVRAYLELLDALGPPRRNASAPVRAAGGVAETVGARAGVAARRRKDRTGERPHRL